MRNRIEDRGLRIKDSESRTEDAGGAVRRAGFFAQSTILDPRPSRGFTLVEMLVVISIVGVLAGEFFKRVWHYQEMAEKAAMQQVVGALQTALILQLGHRLAAGAGLNAINTENPMDWLLQKPGNYAGELNGVNPAAIEPGNWVFDKGRHELVYLPRHAEYLVPAGNGNRWIRYRARLAYEPSNRDKKIMVLAGAAITPVEPYQWLVREKE